MNAKCLKCGNDRFVIAFNLELYEGGIKVLPNEAQCTICGRIHIKDELLTQYAMQNSKEVK